MPRPKRVIKTEQKRSPEARREALLEAALTLFSERGFYGTNVPQLLEKANISAGTMYHQFESKEELVNVLFQRCLQERSNALWEGFSSSLPFRKQFGELWQRYFAFARSRPQVFAFLSFQDHKSYLNEESRRAQEEAQTRLRAFFEGAQSQGVVRSIPIEILLPLVLGGLSGIVQAYLAQGGAFSPESLVEAERSLWEAIRA